jgi:hypothetical protein
MGILFFWIEKLHFTFCGKWNKDHTMLIQYVDVNSIRTDGDFCHQGQDTESPKI